MAEGYDAVIDTRIDSELKEEFKIACDANGEAMSDVLREMIRSYAEKGGIDVEDIETDSGGAVLLVRASEGDEGLSFDVDRVE